MDLDKLRGEFPDWDLGVFWTAVASGPDRCLLWATRGADRLTAWSIDDLAGQLRCYKLHVSPQ